MRYFVYLKKELLPPPPPSLLDYFESVHFKSAKYPRQLRRCR